MKENKKQRMIIIAIFFLIVIICSGVWFLSLRKIAFTESQLDFSTPVSQNPYCGFYHLYGLTLSDSSNVNNVANRCNELIDNDKQQLILLEINLKEYSNSSISEMALNQLKVIFSSFKNAQKQLIVRFLYDWDGMARVSEPDDISKITNHMEQLSPIINDYSDTIYMLQGIFTGNNGELNNSKYMDNGSITTLMNKLYEMVSPDIFLSVRTPSQRRTILQTSDTIAKENVFNGSLSSRLGLFNDGIMGSVNDLGTYGASSYSSHNKEFQPWSRSEELSYQNELCNFVPNGGETVIENPYNDIDSAVEILKTMHVSYLNQDYDIGVLNKWKNSDYNGTNGYYYISSHLGYMYSVINCNIDYNPYSRKDAVLSIEIKNFGFSSAYKKFNTQIILCSKDTGENIYVSSDFDNRLLQPDESKTLEIPLDIYEMKKGNWEIFLQLQDDNTNQYISFANNMSDGEKVLVGTLVIK